MKVSIRAPAWGATRVIEHLHRIGDGFNSRSRVGSDVDTARRTTQRAVSIRAPAWGATRINGQRWDIMAVSIRAPAWGAT